MKIVHVIDSLERGGAETLLIGIVNALTEHEHIIIIMRPDNGFKDELINAEIISFNCSSLWSIPGAVLKLRSLLRKIKPDIVHSHLFWASVVTKLAVNKGTRFFYTNHAVQSHAAFTNTWLTRLERMLYKKWHILISVSGAVEKDYLQYIPVTGKHFVLYNYVDDIYFKHRYKNQRSGKLKAVAVGRLATQKNYPYMLDAVNNTGFDMQLDIYGTGPEKENLEEKISRENITKTQLKYLHPRIYEVLPGYDVFIMSSIFEGQPVSLLEAMAVGLPVLLADIPVLRETAADAGIYFSLEESDSLTKILEKINSGETDLQPYSKRSLERVEEIATKKAYLQKLLSIYQEA